MAKKPEPNAEIAQRLLPPGLYRTLVHIFAQGIEGCMLVGGTALAGYYAGHRRSDDLDLFVSDAGAHQACVLAVGSLHPAIGWLEVRQRTPQFFNVVCRVDDHTFTIQVVLDSRLFEVGTSIRAQDGVAVADLLTLLRQKSATLVSRCSEKDLFDLIWLCEAHPQLTPQELVALGLEIDGGVNPEAIMLSLVGTPLRASACGFSPALSPQEVLAQVTAFKADLVTAFDELARKQPAPPVGNLIRALRPRRRRH